MSKAKLVETEFKGAIRKIKRANYHIGHVKSMELLYFSERPYEFFEELDPNGLQVFKVRSTKDIPEDIELAVSDALSGLRSSLDLAICASGRLDGITDLRNVYFPFSKSPDDWHKIEGGRIGGLRRSVFAQIEEFRPWGGGSKHLYGLSVLSALDKHQLISPVIFVPPRINFMEIKAEADNSVCFVHTESWNSEKREGIIIQVTSGKMSMPKIHLTTHFGFGTVADYRNEPVLELLGDMALECDKVVHALMKIYISS